jgi:Mrp family chromosome partitioning ATPase
MRYFNVDRELRTLMVVSAGPGDGKTTVARHLATAAARMGSRRQDCRRTHRE